MDWRLGIELSKRQKVWVQRINSRSESGFFCLAEYKEKYGNCRVSLMVLRNEPAKLAAECSPGWSEAEPGITIA